jgi:hypothetical protein
MKITIRRWTDNTVIHECEAADIKEALRDARISGANLARANLADAYLAGANLAGANLARANLAGANLAGANLADAYLAGANLAGAYLAGAYLTRAYLAGASPTMLLLASWGDVSDDLCRDLMRLDASAHPDPSAFDRWAAGGACPYADGKITRVANFQERKKCWSPGPPPSLFSLVCRLLAEKGVRWPWDADGKPVS